MAGYEGHGYRRDRPYGARRPEDYRGPRGDYGDRRAGYRGSYEDDWTGERYGDGPRGGFVREGRPYEEGVRGDPRRGRGWGRWEDQDDWDTGDLPPQERTDRDVRWNEPRNQRDWNRQGRSREGDWYETGTRTGGGLSPRERERGSYRPRPGYGSPGGYGLPPYYGDRGGPSMSYGDFGGRPSSERGGSSYGAWDRGDLGERGQRGDSGLRGKGPKSYKRSDERIREDVCDQLMEHDGIDASEVEVQVQDGEVTVEGEVPDRHTKFEIEELADAVLGVREVHNRLRVRRPGGRRERGEGGVAGSSAEPGQQADRAERGGRKTPPIRR